jgi:glycerol uptake facilitator-like aquaporin
MTKKCQPYRFSTHLLLKRSVIFPHVRYMEKGVVAGVAIGSTVALNALIGGPMAGASMNPARSFGPALVSWHLDLLWIYLTAPVFGMFLAYPACRWIQGDKCCIKEETKK